MPGSSTPPSRPTGDPGPGARARPEVRPTGEERRAQIVREAMRCFASKGFRGTTTRDVAARVGISEAALYRYFDSKEALYAAIIDEKMAAADPVRAVEGAARQRDDHAVFTGLARAFSESVEADPSFLRILLYTALEGHALAAPFFETRVRRLREFLARYIERRAREGAFRRIDPLLGARAFIGMVVNHLIAREVFRQRDTYPQEPGDFIETFVSIFLEGVRDRKEPADG